MIIQFLYAAVTTTWTTTLTIAPGAMTYTIEGVSRSEEVTLSTLCLWTIDECQHRQLNQ
jgi:hypothetical protein